MKELLQAIAKKITSGKWILTVACAVAFLYCVWHKVLNEAAVTAIIISVFKDYFDKKGHDGDTSRTTTTT